MSNQWSLRPATREDLPLLFKVEQQTYRSPWTLDHFESELSKPYSYTLVLTDDETDSQIAGYVVFWLMGEESEILNLAIDTPYRGLGLAKKMIFQVIRLASHKGMKRVVLEVRKSNMAAIQLYQGCRFSITHIRKGFYSDGEDAYHMTLYIDEVQATE